MTAQVNRCPDNSAGDSARQPLKMELALSLLVDAYRADRYITTLDALNTYGDTCWHTSVATLRDKGLTFKQRLHRHTHQSGGVARFQAYKLEAGSLARAEELLATYRRARGETHVSA